MFAATIVACDFFEQKDQPQAAPTADGGIPYIHVVAANVGLGTPLPQDGVIAITFDRYLNASTVNRQGVALRDEFGNAPDSPLVDYDPVTRVVRLSNPNPGQAWLQVGTPYQLQFPIPGAEAGAFGLRAIDGATFDPTAGAIGFTVSAPTGNPPQDPKIDFCADVFPLFAAQRTNASRGLCSNKACHGTQTLDPQLSAAMGLVLESEDGIRHTALGVLAEEAATNALTTASSPQATFPSGMPIIDPGNPANSYLIYKLLLPPQANDLTTVAPPLAYTLTCSKTVTAPFDYGPSASFASADESARLAVHVIGRRMPWGSLDNSGPDYSQPAAQMSLDDIERIRLWITQGAIVDDCSTCQAQLTP